MTRRRPTPVPDLAGLPRRPRGRPPGTTSAPATPEQAAARLEQLADAAREVRQTREALGWTQAELAEALTGAGVPCSRALVSLWERAPYVRRNPSRPSSEALAVLRQLREARALLSVRPGDLTPEGFAAAWQAMATMRAVQQLGGGGEEAKPKPPRAED